MQAVRLDHFENRMLLIEVAAGLAAFVLGVAVARGSWEIVVALIAVPLMVLWPVQAVLGAFVFVIPWDSVSLLGAEGEGGTSLTFYTGTAVIVVLLAVGLLYKRWKSPPRAAAYWAGFVALAGCSILWAADPSVGIERMYTAVPLIALYLIATSISLTKRELLSAATCAIAGAVFASTYAIFTSGGAGRISLHAVGSSTDPNQFANLVLLGISLALGAYFASELWTVKAMAAVAFAIILYALFMSMSRGALSAVAVIIAVYLYRMGAHRRLVIPIAIGVSLVWLLPTLFFQRMENFAAGRGEGRFDIWLAGLHMVKDHFMIGVGLDNFPTAYQQYAGYAPRFWGYYRAPHNIYLGAWSELGIAGIALLLLAIVSQLREANQAQRRSQKFSWTIPFEAVCWAMVVDGASLDILWRKSFWIAWILLAAAVQLQRQEDQENHGTQPSLKSHPSRQWIECPKQVLR